MTKGLRNKQHRKRAGVDEFIQREETREKARREERGQVVDEYDKPISITVDYSRLAKRIAQVLEQGNDVISSAFRQAAEQVQQQALLAASFRNEPMVVNRSTAYPARIEWVDFLIERGSRNIEYVVKMAHSEPLRVGRGVLAEKISYHFATYGESPLIVELRSVLDATRNGAGLPHSMRVDATGCQKIPARIVCVDIDPGDPGVLVRNYAVSVTYENGDIIGGESGASLDAAIRRIERDLYFYPGRTTPDLRGMLRRLEQIRRQQQREFEAAARLSPGTPVYIGSDGLLHPVTPEQNRGVFGIAIGGAVVSTSEGPISFPAGSAEFFEQPAPEPKPETPSSPFKHLEI